MKSKLTGLSLLLSLCMGAVALCVGVVGCANEHHHHSDSPAYAPPPAAYRYDDRDVAVRVRNALTDTEFRYNNVTVECLRGNVVLTGVVPTRKYREQAANVTRHIAGVVSVDNRIVIR